MFAELASAGLISVRRADAAGFLHAQLTSDIAGLSAQATQYSGYCSPKGRLLATFLVWRLENEILLQLPVSLREAIQARLAKYVLRSKVELADATDDYRLFGVWGRALAQALPGLGIVLPEHAHAVARGPASFATRVPIERVALLAPASEAAHVRAQLAAHAQEQPEAHWARLDIEAGIPHIGLATQDEFVPQMVNLDAIGGVSYTKGCYPGQEIVARTRYLGRLKQRMYRVRVPAPDVAAADPLYSSRFGPDQASGTILNAVRDGDARSQALAVVQIAAADGDLRWRSPDGPVVAFESLPYTVPA